MDSRIIDVAIGLVLVFALTSLLVATLVEAMSTMRKQRGQVLRQAITSFVGDNAAFAQRLLNHPLIVSLAPKPEDDPDRKPSYIGADVMITSLLAELTNSYSGGVRPVAPADLVAAINSKEGPRPAMQVPANFAHGLTSLLPGVENDWPAFERRLQAWFDSVTERSIGWYKRWIQAWLFGIGLLVAGAVNINPLVIAPHLWNDAALREAVARLGVSASEQYEASKSAQTPAAGGEKTGNNDASTGVNRTTSPSSSGSQPQRTDATAAVARDYEGLSQSVLHAMDAARDRADDTEDQTRIRIIQLLQSLRDNLDRMRLPDDDTTAYLHNHAHATLAIDHALAQLQTLIPREEIYAPAHRWRDALVTSIAAERDALLLLTGKRRLKCTETEDPTIKNLCLRLKDLDNLEQAGLPIGWSASAMPKVGEVTPCKRLPDGSKQTTDCGKSLAQQAMTIGILLAGWIVTAIAVTLGAPFWFDVLSKLVKLRGSGTRIDGEADAGQRKPTTTDAPASTTGTSTTPLNRQPMSDALNAAEAALPEHEIRRIQRALLLPDISVSGYFDSSTRAAIKQWQTQQGQDATGELTQAQIQQLLGLTSDANDDYLA